MSWNIKTPGDYINGPLTVAGSATITGTATLSGNTLNVGGGNSSPVVNFKAADTGSVTLNFGGTTNPDKGRILYSDNSDLFAFYTADTERYRIDTTGISTWSVAGTTAMTLNSTGLGIGDPPNRNLDVRKDQSAATIARVQNQSVNAAAYSELNLAASGNNWGIRTGSTAANSNRLEFVVDPSGTNLTAIALTSSGNVGIGVTPSAWTSYKALQINTISSIAGSTGSTDVGMNWIYKSGDKYIGNGLASSYVQYNGSHIWNTAANNVLGAEAALTWTPAMTLEASGVFLIGLPTSVATNSGSFIFSPGTSSYGGVLSINHSTSNVNGSGFVNFNYNATNIGSISQNGTTGVLYNIVSDYRLKESIVPISGGLARVNALKPSVYNWKSDGSTGEGFLAHELAEVVPFAVTGEKDAVDKDGKIKPQGIDMSRVVPILVAAIQELTARVQTLEAR